MRLKSRVTVITGGGIGSATANTRVSVAAFGFGIRSPNINALHADIFPVRALGRAMGMTGLVVARSGYAPVFRIAGLIARTAVPRAGVEA